MITLNDIITDNQKVILNMFDPEKIQRKQKEIDNFNKKTKNFLESVKNLKIDL